MNNDIFNADKKPAPQPASAPVAPEQPAPFKHKDKEFFRQKEFEYGEYESPEKMGRRRIEYSGRYNWEYALEKIEKIAEETEHIKSALKMIEAIGESVDGSGASKADAIRETVRAREDTNRKLINFYQAMYDDLKPRNPSANNKDMLKQNVIDKLMSVNLELLENPDGFLEKMIALAEAL